MHIFLNETREIRLPRNRAQYMIEIQLKKKNFILIQVKRVELYVYPCLLYIRCYPVTRSDNIFKTKINSKPSTFLIDIHVTYSNDIYRNTFSSPTFIKLSDVVRKKGTSVFGLTCLDLKSRSIKLFYQS